MRTLTTLLLSSCLVMAVYGSPRFTRDICAQSTEQYAACNAKAYEVYSQAFAAGDDGRPDWMARKSCNFMTTTIEECSNALVGACFSEEEVDDMKDTQVEVFLAQVKKNMPNWDSSKCPAAIAYNERKNPSCEKVNEKLKEAHSLCTAKAFDDYRAAYQAGDDGRPDWMARKSCNYMTAAVEECGNRLIGKCKSVTEVNAMKDEQIRLVLVQLQTNIAEWDSNKCPATKAHVERIMATDKEIVVAAAVGAYFTDLFSLYI